MFHILKFRNKYLNFFEVMEIDTVKQNIKTTKRVYISIVAIGDGVEGIFYLIALLDLFIVLQ